MDQLSFAELLVPSPKSTSEFRGGRRLHFRAGRPRSLSGWEAEQKNAATKAKSARRELLSDEAIRERDRRQQKKRDAKRYKRCRDEINAASRKYYQENTAAQAEAAAKRYRRTLLQGMVYRAEKRAKERCLPFNLTVNDILIHEFCPVLGIPMAVGRENRWMKNTSPTLDRIIGELGYVKGNVRVISWRANKIKNDATLEELERIVSYIRGAACQTSP